MSKRTPFIVGLLSAVLLVCACGDELDYTTSDGIFVRHQYGDLRDEALA